MLETLLVVALRQYKRPEGWSCALYELKKEARTVSANAVVGVDLDYVELSASGSMVLLVASGTAVIIEDATDGNL